MSPAPLLLLIISCTGQAPGPATPASGPAADASPASPPAADASTQTEADASTQTEGSAPPQGPAPPQAAIGREDGWGAVLARDGTMYRTSAGDLAAGARGVVTLTGSGRQGPCGEQIAPAEGAMIIPPAGSPSPTVQPAPVIRAALVERAAWRLDELLPQADVFSPLVTDPDPTRGRGVELGSVAKVRRELAPPVLLAAGVRSCTGALAILDADASRVLTWHRIDDACEALRVLPPTDLDGDGHRELAAWSRSRVTLYRLTEGPGDPALTLLADWSCK